MQQANYLLGNGVELENDAMKGKLGIGFDTTLAKSGCMRWCMAFAGGTGTSTTLRFCERTRTK